MNELGFPKSHHSRSTGVSNLKIIGTGIYKKPAKGIEPLTYGLRNHCSTD